MTKQQVEPAWEGILGHLWGSHLEELRISLPLHRVVMTVRLTGPIGKSPSKAGRTIVEWHELTFEGVTRFVFADEMGAGPWRVTELVDIGKREAKGQTEYGFTVMEREDALLITCDEVRVTLMRADEWSDRAAR